MTICVFVLMAVLYVGLYVHDRMVTESYSQSALNLWAHTPKDIRDDESEAEDRLYERLHSGLFLFEVNQVHIDSNIISCSVGVSYGYRIKIKWLKRALGDGSGYEEYSCESTVPAKLKWTADAVKELKGAKKNDD